MEKSENNSLSIEELENGVGGFETDTVTVYSFDEGDCFEYRLMKIKVKTSYTRVSGDTWIDCREKINLCESDTSYLAGDPAFSKENYRGRYAFDF